MNDTTPHGYDADDAYGSSGYNSPGYQSPGYSTSGYQALGYGDGTGYGAVSANCYQETGYMLPDIWASGYQENIYDRANLLDTPYRDTEANPNPSNEVTFTS